MNLGNKTSQRSFSMMIRIVDNKNSIRVSVQFSKHLGNRFSHTTASLLFFTHLTITLDNFMFNKYPFLRTKKFQEFISKSVF